MTLPPLSQSAGWLFVPVLFNKALVTVDDSKLTNMALAALEEIAALSRFGPIERSRPLAVVLAYLASRATAADRRVYDNFWRSITHPRPHDRSAIVQAAMEGIYKNAGIKRSLAIVTHFQTKAIAIMGRNPPP